jgi:hypothetical protein
MITTLSFLLLLLLLLLLACLLLLLLLLLSYACAFFTSHRRPHLHQHRCSTMSSSVGPKASSLSLAQEVYEEGGIEAVLEMLSSRTTVMQVAGASSSLFRASIFPFRSKPRCCFGNYLRVTLVLATLSSAVASSASCTCSRLARVSFMLSVAIILNESSNLPHVSVPSSTLVFGGICFKVEAVETRKNCAGALSSLVRNEDACAQAVQAGAPFHILTKRCFSFFLRRHPHINCRSSLEQRLRFR